MQVMTPTADTTANTDALAALPKRKPWFPAFFSLFVMLFIGWGWQNHSDSVISPDTGFGYMLGIIGATLMVLLLLYPLRKRVRFMRHLPATKHWFRLHMIFGIVGPTAILFHCNFEVGALNSRVALYCMLLVVASGVIGRYFYAKLHAGLYGQKLSSAHLLSLAREQKQILSNRYLQYSDVQQRLDALFAALIPADPFRVSLTGAVLAAPRRYFLQRGFGRFVRQHKDPALAEIWQQTRRPLNDYLQTLRKLAQLQFFDRLFAWWHVLHLPIFIMMLLTMIVHIWAVHAY